MAEETQAPEAAPAAEQKPAEAPAPKAPEGGPRVAGRGGGRDNNRRGPGGGRFGGRPGGNRGPRPRPNDQPDDGLVEKVIFINRSTKVVKGGRRFGFSALVVVGDQEGKVGLGFGKAGEVVEAIRKGSQDARAVQEDVRLVDGTLPHEVYSVYDGARVLLRPASTGTGIIAGKTVRAVLEAAGVKNVLSKSLGSNNPANVAKATLQGLRRLRREREVNKIRGLQPAASEA